MPWLWPCVTVDESLLSRASTLAITADETLLDLEAANEIQSSPIRSAIIGHLEVEMSTLDRAITADHGKNVRSASDEIDSAIETVAAYAALAEIEWQTSYALFLQAVALDDHNALIELAWRDAAKRWGLPLAPAGIGGHWAPMPSPQAMRSEFRLLLTARVEADLARRASNIQAIRELGVLNIDDVNPVLVSTGTGSTTYFDWLVLKHALNLSKSTADAHARVAKRRHQIQLAKRAQQRAQPGLVSQIWSVVGWDSGSDFITDVALIGLTGGASKAFRWAAKARKARSRIAKAKKLSRSLSKQIDELERLDRRIRHSEKKIIKRAEKLRKINDRVKKLSHWMKRTQSVLENSREGVKLVDLVGNIFDATPSRLLRSVATSAAADVLNQRTGTGGGSTSKAGEELVRKAINEQLKGIHPFSQIPELKSRLTRTMLMSNDDVGREVMMEFYMLLVARQLVGRLALEQARERSVLLSVEAYTDMVISSWGAAVQDLFLEYGLDNRIADELAQDMVNVVRKYLVNALKPLVRKLIEAAKA